MFVIVALCDIVGSSVRLTLRSLLNVVDGDDVPKPVTVGVTRSVFVEVCDLLALPVLLIVSVKKVVALCDIVSERLLLALTSLLYVAVTENDP